VQDEITREGEYGQVRWTHRGDFIRQQGEAGTGQAAGQTRLARIVGADGEQTPVAAPDSRCVERKVPVAEMIEDHFRDLHLGILEQLPESPAFGSTVTLHVQDVSVG